MVWEHFQHGADIGVRGIGSTMDAAYSEAALAMTAVVTDPAGVAGRIPVDIRCEAPDDELLFADWLNALIWEMATRNLLFGRFDCRVANHRIEATAWGEPVDVARHQPAVEVKGATYTALSVHRRADGMWVAQCVVDV